MKRYVTQIFGVLFFVVLFVFAFLLGGDAPQKVTPQFGVTFSVVYARYLGFDPNVLLQNILTDLRPTVVRFPVYWTDIEKVEGDFVFDEYHVLLRELQKTNTPVILTVGYKVPRFPECHAPEWTTSLSAHAFEERLRSYVATTVHEFVSYDNIVMWQVENEPFFDFGENCRDRSYDDIAKEVALVKRIDGRPILITDSGELSWWRDAISLADVFGTTMYRTVYNEMTGYLTMPLRSVFYYRKSLVTRAFVNDVPVINAELQMEPWVARGVRDTDISELSTIFTPDDFAEHLTFARDSGFSLHILWGVEYWYYAARHGNDDLLLSAQELWK